MMYETLRQPDPDRIVQLSQIYREDSRANKLDLGIGIYRDANGRTPVMAAVKVAEAALLKGEDTKAYISPLGEERFNHAALHLLLGATVEASRSVVAQTPGAGGAIRLLAELIRAMDPDSTVWISDPTWINHHPIMQIVGLEHRPYPYLDRERQEVAFEAMLDTLGKARPGDVILVHGSCHNPTGCDLTSDQWDELARLVNKQGLIPLVDVAYQGFGEGIEPDVRGVRRLIEQTPDALLTVSCSKSFGLYRERVGCAIALTRSADIASLVRANLASLARVNYSFPPSHGAAVVARILEDTALRNRWADELDAMRHRILINRVMLVENMRRHLEDTRFDYIARQRGMFSLLGLNELQVERLRREDAIFLPPDSRLNLTGLTTESSARLAAAITRVMRPSA
jgi:aspartate/tyrosine/aromatic aminotransferase